MTKSAPKTYEEVEEQLKAALEADNALLVGIQTADEKRHPLLSRIWFYLTGWRPATKFEYVKLQQGFVKLSCAVINLHKHQSILIAEVNNHSLMLKGQIAAQEESKKSTDVAFA